MENQQKHQPQLRLLPNYFKKIGIGLFLFAIIVLKLLNFFLKELNPIWFENYHDFLRIIRFDIAIIGLLLFAFAKDKIEDELTLLLRLQSIAYAFIFGVLFVLIRPFFDFIDGGQISEVDGRLIITIMLVMYIFTFILRKKNM